VKEIPEKYDPNEAEPKWRKIWEERGIYKWDPARPRSETFVVDTPPPTVSGSLHVGHVFSYTQTDTIVRFQRMLGKNIFYPIGWDDNGLPTERRVQNYFGIKCDVSKAYDPSWKPKHDPSLKDKSEKDKKIEYVSRRNFIEACAILTREDEQVFERLWRTVGLSYDWGLQYATIDKHCSRISQLSFLELVKQGQVYNSVAPTMWDTDFQSAIAQAEVEDKEIAGAFHDIRFAVEGGAEFIIATTRPELLPACIAVVANPKDERYKKFFGKTAITPLFHSPVPILAADHADPEKGSGILMVCTFGDIMDVQWWKQSGLALKQVIGLDGKLLPIEHGKEPFKSLNPEKANAAQKELSGLFIKQAQKKIVELLRSADSAASGLKPAPALTAEPKPITHPVKFYEKGDRPLEFIPTRQWFQKIMEHKSALVEQGRNISWHPEYMLSRYENWVQGLNQDWCLSRQRYFGVPFPVWYKIDSNGAIDYQNPIFAKAETLPVDPLLDCPPGFKPENRDKAGGFAGDPDVMDTWATSCVTPQIESHWGLDENRHKKLFPMDIRPQAHDIIRTWAFYTIVRAWNHERQIPWKHAVISGFIMDPDRKKMSKSKGNAITPEGLLAEHSSDAVRYWASRARLGVDTAFDQKLFGIGRKLATKIFNASRFLVLQFERVGTSPSACDVSDITEELDRAMVSKLRAVIETATLNFEQFNFAVSLQESEDAFWFFCDHYLELAKVRSYGEADTPGRRSALATLSWSLKTFLRLFAPVQPYVTEEVWSWSFSGDAQNSIHISAWPKIEEVSSVAAPSDERALGAAVELIGKIRGVKTALQKSLKWEVETLTVTCPDDCRKVLDSILSDVLKAGNVKSDGIKIVQGSSPQNQLFGVEVQLSENWVPSALNP